jgi:hypothetical protein
LRDDDDIAEALAALKRRHPALRRAVIKLENGFSGEGNALFSFDGAPSGADLRRWTRTHLPTRVQFEASGESWDHYSQAFTGMGGIVECFLEGDDVRSPSVQCRVDPLRHTSIISTHDQLLGGPSGQVFLGCMFPADAPYRQAIQEAALRIADVLAKQGVLGRFAIDFLTRRCGDRWESSALEINLRKGGTTHPFLMLQFLTDGEYEPETGTYLTRTGRPCFYTASDNLGHAGYRGMTPDELIDIAVSNDLHYDAATQQGVMFHLLGALAPHGKFGTVCIGDSPATADRYFREVNAVLDRESAR